MGYDDLYDSDGKIDKRKLDKFSAQLEAERESQDMDKALALLGRGWIPDSPPKPLCVMAWYWRSPSKGKKTWTALSKYRSGLRGFK